MAQFRKAFVAAVVKSLLRGKSLIQAILAYWLSGNKKDSVPKKTLQQFLKDAEAALVGPISGNGLQEISAKLKEQILEGLNVDMQCMLPSYSHQLPAGSEVGQYLALDVGGSTLRVALVELRGRGVGSENATEIVSIQNYRITKDVKDLEGMAFFEWMAARITETIQSTLNRPHSAENPLPIALAWSFPIEQTSLGGGRLAAMGKGFLADIGLVGQDLGDIVRTACKNRDLHVELKAILNDSSACLLSRAYSHSSTRFGLILGTGVNIAAYLPVSAIGRTKFGERPAGWFDEASHVIVNTELGMFGGKILPLTRWDLQLLKEHPRPDFQPLEYMTSGMYLGEIVRLIMVEAIQTTGLLGGILPPSLTGLYSLGTEVISLIEGDTSADLSEAISCFSEKYPSSHTPSVVDMGAIKAIASFVSVRSSALIASAVYALWDIRLEGDEKFLSTLPESSPLRHKVEEDIKMEKTTVAFNGSVIEHYPGYLENCQRYINELLDTHPSTQPKAIELVSAKESSLTGAAVALACVDS
ncbi:hexokinase-1 [Trichoderma reesei RUT C-30]|uniref:Phosphotransferase n=1 Tax=Hypocrea jecorina (strain ATCC 56765 / BCRC 32924 / NRRL 11460 / Rut C-30) TaxID=1344414 RepID=A0A024S5Z2_HYPJR|nr:hexokinase-1 [Trichoderma reesei RUT C-30]